MQLQLSFTVLIEYLPIQHPNTLFQNIIPIHHSNSFFQYIIPIHYSNTSFQMYKEWCIGMYWNYVLEWTGIMHWNNKLEWCIGLMYWNVLAGAKRVGTFGAWPNAQRKNLRIYKKKLDNTRREIFKSVAAHLDNLYLIMIFQFNS